MGLLEIELFLNDCMSLKDKRRVMKRLKDGIKNSFNTSVAEIGALDKWQRSVLGMAVISNDSKYLSGCLDSLVDFIEKEKRVKILDYSIEML